MATKKFKMLDAILAVICVVFVVEAAAPVAALGNSQYFWWLFMIIAFLLPYGLIASELGTTYNGDAGMYDWLRKAYPKGKMPARTAWYYWVNFPLWMASLAVMCPSLLSVIFGWEINGFLTLIIELCFIWLVVFISFYPVSDSSWILNGSATIKVLLALIMGGLGIYAAITKGLANNISIASLVPTFDLNSISYVSVIIFNCLGFEVICTFADSMENPKKQIPKAIIIGGFVIAAIYIFCAFGIGAAIPSDKISSDTGLLDAMALITGKDSGLFIAIMAMLFLLTLFGNMTSWSLGVNSVAAIAADNNELPKIFKWRSKANSMPIGASIMNGILATIIVIIGAFLPDSNLFWSFFALNLVLFLLSYLPVFPAFLTLRKNDPHTIRPFKVPGNNTIQKIIAIIPMILIIIAIIFTAVPMSLDKETITNTLPITIGAVIFIILGEIIINICKKRSS